MPGVPLQDLWTDIRPIGSRTAERLGYPTQKPEALLERILQASSNELILDCFCGCGTTIAAAERLKRRWIGIDITHLAISLIRHRLRHSHGDPIEETYTVVGEPVELPDAITLARDDPFQSDREGVRPVRPVDDQHAVLDQVASDERDQSLGAKICSHRRPRFDLQEAGDSDPARVDWHDLVLVGSRRHRPASNDG